MKRILIVSHCLLNTASKVNSYKTEAMQAEEELRRRVVVQAVENGVQLVQLPCPEFLMYGMKRWGHVSDQFDNPFFRERCREILKPVLLQIREYAGNETETELLGILGIDGSPSCGVKYTCRGHWGGEFGGRDLSEAVGPVSLAEGMGIFMEELREMLTKEKLSVRMEGLFAREPERALSMTGGQQEEPYGRN